jgi:mono/diheme cytochrome c family protein
MMQRWKTLRAATFGLVIFPFLSLGLKGQDAADPTLARNVQAILARRCFACHGPDHAEAGLRLDDSASATALLESGSQAIVPGDPIKSHLMERIVSEDESQRMPPEGKPLGDEERQLIARWIEQGAVWHRLVGSKCLSGCQGASRIILSMPSSIRNCRVPGFSDRRGPPIRNS